MICDNTVAEYIDSPIPIVKREPDPDVDSVVPAWMGVCAIVNQLSFCL